jgi:hypothetical protein
VITRAHVGRKPRLPPGDKSPPISIEEIAVTSYPRRSRGPAPGIGKASPCPRRPKTGVTNAEIVCSIQPLTHHRHPFLLPNSHD